MKTADFSYEKVSYWNGETFVTQKKPSGCRSPLVHSFHSNLGYIPATHCDKKLAVLNVSRLESSLKKEGCFEEYTLQYLKNEMK